MPHYLKEIHKYNKIKQYNNKIAYFMGQHDTRH